jgi:hypothetical protein
MKTDVSILAEIPEDLYQSLERYLSRYPEWDKERVFCAAISLFLLQNGERDRRASRVYLNSIFRSPA